RAVLDGRVGWEEALLSMRVNLHRDPDQFDSRLMGLLRYGNEPVQTLQMSREINCAETIERDGVRMQRFCPHAGEDLKHATVCNGVIECPRHHWKWDAQTGECLEGDVRDRAAVGHAVAGCDYVFHQAAIRITLCAERPRDCLDVLVGGTFNVFEAAAAAGVRKVVYASSASVYGAAEVFPTDER